MLNYNWNKTDQMNENVFAIEYMNLTRDILSIG